MIQTDRLTLRRIQSRDVDDLHAVFTRPEAMRYWSTLPHTERVQTEEWVEATRTADPAVTDDFVVEIDGRVIGKAGAWHLPEIGIILHPDHWRRGIASEALTAVIDHLFQAHPTLQTLTADVDPRNRASLGLLQSLGFEVIGHETGTFQLGDELCDSTYLELYRHNWPRDSSVTQG